MDNEIQEQELLDLSSTYSILTADRILDRWGLKLTQDELAKVVKNPNSVYYQLLVVPFNNIINGIILQQTYDYQVYAQKLFVDYLISGSGNDNEESPGATVRADLEQSRLKLVSLSELFERDILTHKTLIGESQGHLNDVMRSLRPLLDTEQTAQAIEKSIAPFRDRSLELAQGLRNYRSEFKTIILDVLRLIQLLPDYHVNEEQEEINRAALQFDDQLG